RAEGLSISVEAHLLGDKVEYDEEAGTLIIKGLPTTLVDQLKRRKADTPKPAEGGHQRLLGRLAQPLHQPLLAQRPAFVRPLLDIH
ncbi:hypothetical protein ABFV62_29950, partial [Pseudomonas syringae]|uniref:nucleoid-associated protein n=1 Tax=Pseudomonas syringae TaxID=317 RepID=UPI0034D9E257